MSAAVRRSTDRTTKRATDRAARLPARLTAVTAAELAKLRTLPAAVATALATVLAGAVIAAALAVYAADRGTPVSPVAAVVQAIPYVQAGLVLVGIWPVAHEYAGVQIRTTLVAVPDRGLLLAGKTAAALVAVALTAAATVGAGLAAAATAGEPSWTGTDPRTALGAAAYLTLLGLLSHAVALLLRHLVPALVGMLSLVLIASPLLGGLTGHARWLPDRAGALLYDPAADTVLTGATGTLVLLGWIALIGAAAATRFARSDP
ncbi:ABC transporter permease [Nocardiopsis protaetiae]|uniref:ABC transporter permease n=1 Tax=Nocardiopsis protaetiae TaxID=3382270 RepID=UPI00387B3843